MGRGLKSCNEKEREATEVRGSLVNLGEMLHEGVVCVCGEEGGGGVGEEACENPMRWSSMGDGPMKTVEYT